jgi:hypothetical protein
MPLQTIRQQAVKISGRYDLASADFTSDEGMDFYIRAAQDFLDGLLPAEALRRMVPITLLAGENTVTTDRLLRIERIWYVDLLGHVTVLDEERRSWIRPSTGWPLAYHLEYPTGVVGEPRVVRIHPTPMHTVVLHVEGLFRSPRLLANGDVSFWTEEHPDILIQAILYKLEAFYGNTQGMNDYLAAVHNAVDMLDHNFVESMLAYRLGLENSW